MLTKEWNLETPNVNESSYRQDHELYNSIGATCSKFVNTQRQEVVELLPVLRQKSSEE